MVGDHSYRYEAPTPKEAKFNAEYSVWVTGRTYSKRDVGKMPIPASNDTRRLVGARPRNHRRRAVNLVDDLGQRIEHSQPSVRVRNEGVAAQQFGALVRRQLKHTASR